MAHQLFEVGMEFFLIVGGLQGLTGGLGVAPLAAQGRLFRQQHPRPRVGGGQGGGGPGEAVAQHHHVVLGVPLDPIGGRRLGHGAGQPHGQRTKPRRAHGGFLEKIAPGKIKAHILFLLCLAAASQRRGGTAP